MSKGNRYRSGSGASVSGNLAVVYRTTDQLKPDPSNPRRHSRKQIRQIASSIATFGFNVPILIDGEGKVIAGHDPAYVDTIVRRWQALTGGSARHGASGSSFDDLAREAEIANAA
jgi:hypothetical protein